MFNLPIFSSNVPGAVAAFAAAITAAYASLKYYSDKAAKVTEFRKAWIESLRQAVAEFSGSTHTIAGRIAIRTKVDAEHPGNNTTHPNRLHRFLKFLDGSKPIAAPVEKELATELLTHWSVLRLSYNKIVLHLNPAEHIAYSLAETAIANHTRSTAPDDAVRMEISEFLNWCIQLAQYRAQENPKRGLLRQFLGKKSVCHVIKNPLLDGILGTAMTEIHKACVDPGSALLLAAFATRQLLHGSYKNVFNNINSIEQGIRVVDTSAAIVIKGVWENIKKGEPAYRWTSNVAMVSSLMLIISILSSLLSPIPTPPASLKLVISCTAKVATPPIVGARNSNPVISRMFDCETIPKK